MTQLRVERINRTLDRLPEWLKLDDGQGAIFLASVRILDGPIVAGVVYPMELDLWMCDCCLRVTAVDAPGHRAIGLHRMSMAFRAGDALARLDHMEAAMVDVIDRMAKSEWN